MSSDGPAWPPVAPGATHSPIRDSGEHAAPEKPAEGLSAPRSLGEACAPLAERIGEIWQRIKPTSGIRTEREEST